MKSFHIDRNMKDKVKIRLAIEKVCKSKKEAKRTTNEEIPTGAENSCEY